jgi:CRP-like cAMP-binding protein
MAIASPKLHSNLLLATLSPKDRALISDVSSIVALNAGSVLIDRGDRLRYVYFPLDCVFSLLATADEHSMVEVAMIGREGVAGYIEALGGRIATSRILVVHGGAAVRITVSQILQLLDGSPALREVLNHYLFAYISQLAQTVACTRFHQIEPRLARWLLMVDDRSTAQDFSMTQDSLAILLGVRRVGISAAAVAFKSKRLIEYTRGNLRLMNRLSLESEACMCYRSDLASYERIENYRRVSAK